MGFLQQRKTHYFPILFKYFIIKTKIVNTIITISLLQTTIKVFARCLRPDIEYKTLSVTWGTRAREVVSTLLGKFRMRHRDPRLFYLSMEVRVRAAGLRTTLVLDDDARPAALQACHPKGYSK